MPVPLRLRLTTEERASLQRVRDHHAKPYVRERAAAILRVAAGQSARAVARSGCLKPRRVETVSGWVTAFRTRGVAGLLVAAGRGRKPASPPQPRRSPGRGGRPSRATPTYRPRRLGGGAAPLAAPV